MRSLRNLSESSGFGAGRKRSRDVSAKHWKNTATRCTCKAETQSQLPASLASLFDESCRQLDVGFCLHQLAAGLRRRRKTRAKCGNPAVLSLAIDLGALECHHDVAARLLHVEMVLLSVALEIILVLGLHMLLLRLVRPARRSTHEVDPNARTTRRGAFSRLHAVLSLAAMADHEVVEALALE